MRWPSHYLNNCSKMTSNKCSYSCVGGDRCGLKRHPYFPIVSVLFTDGYVFCIWRVSSKILFCSGFKFSDCFVYAFGFVILEYHLHANSRSVYNCPPTNNCVMMLSVASKWLVIYTVFFQRMSNIEFTCHIMLNKALRCLWLELWCHDKALILVCCIPVCEICTQILLYRKKSTNHQS